MGPYAARRTNYHPHELLPSSSSLFFLLLVLRLLPVVSISPGEPIGAALINAWYFLSCVVSLAPVNAWPGRWMARRGG